MQADVALQKQILEVVKKARIAELKGMLQNVPISGSATFNFPIMRMAAGIIGAGILVASISYYLKKGTAEIPNMSSSMEDSIKKIEPNDFEPLEEPTLPQEPTQSSEKKVDGSFDKSSKKIDAPRKQEAKTFQPTMPKIEAIDPSNELIDNSQKVAPNKEINKASITTSQIVVDVDSSEKKYSFHYQFSNGKLILYGSFDKALFEILEINGDKHSVFMFYKDNYYRLNEKDTRITLLEPIQDKELVAKLKEFRVR